MLREGALSLAERWSAFTHLSFLGRTQPPSMWCSYQLHPGEMKRKLAHADAPCTASIGENSTRDVDTTFFLSICVRYILYCIYSYHRGYLTVVELYSNSAPGRQLANPALRKPHYCRNNQNFADTFPFGRASCAIPLRR